MRMRSFARYLGASILVGYLLHIVFNVVVECADSEQEDSHTVFYVLEEGSWMWSGSGPLAAEGPQSPEDLEPLEGVFCLLIDPGGEEFKGSLCEVSFSTRESVIVGARPHGAGGYSCRRMDEQRSLACGVIYCEIDGHYGELDAGGDFGACDGLCAEPPRILMHVRGRLSGVDRYVELSIVALPVPEDVVMFFHRGDVDGDGIANVTDAVVGLMFVFLKGRAPSCADAADANDDGTIDVTDSVLVLHHLFAGGVPPRSPSTFCGVDPTEDGLDCQGQPACMGE